MRVVQKVLSLIRKKEPFLHIFVAAKQYHL